MSRFFSSFLFIFRSSLIRKTCSLLSSSLSLKLDDDASDSGAFNGNRDEAVPDGSDRLFGGATLEERSCRSVPVDLRVPSLERASLLGDTTLHPFPGLPAPRSSFFLAFHSCIALALVP